MTVLLSSYSKHLIPNDDVIDNDVIDNAINVCTFALSDLTDPVLTFVIHFG